MKRSEMAEHPFRDISMRNYEWIFSNASREHINIAGTISSQLLFSHVDSESDYFGIFSGNELVAIMIISDERFAVPLIELTQTVAAYKSQGLQRYMLSRALAKFSEIYSDSQQTTDAVNFWKSLIQYGGVDFCVTTANLPAFTPAKIEDVCKTGEDESPMLKVTKK